MRYSTTGISNNLVCIFLFIEETDVGHRDTFTKILQQADDTLKSTEYLGEISAGQDNSYIVDYFKRIKAKIALEELRFY